MPSEVETLSTLKACISPACFWWPERTQAESTWLEHAPFAFWIVDALRPRTLVELGTRDGYSYLAFCQAVKHLELDTRCHAIAWGGDSHDCFSAQDVVRDLRSYHDDRYSTFSTLIPATCEGAPPHCADQTVDLLHIVGCHDYDQIKRHFAAWRPKLSDRSVALFHDTNVAERGFGVARLWEDLRLSMPHFEFLHGHGLGVLRVGENLPAPVLALFAAAANPQATSRVRSVYSRLGFACSLHFTKERQASELKRRYAEVHGLREELARLSAEADALRSQAAMQSALAVQAEANLTSLRGRVMEVTNALGERTAGAIRLSHESNVALTAVRSQNVELHAALLAARRQIDHQQAALDEHAAQLTAIGQRAALAEATCAARDRELRFVERSLSWRTTKPYRWIRAQMSGPGLRSARLLQRACSILPFPLAGRLRDFRANRANLALLTASDLFDSDWYLERNPDVRAAGMNPLLHYLRYGAAEGRDPNPLFDGDWYLDRNPDVRAAGMNPLAHYLRYGAAEGRDPSASVGTQGQLTNHPDAAIAGANPPAHNPRPGAIAKRGAPRSDDAQFSDDSRCHDSSLRTSEERLSPPRHLPDRYLLEYRHRAAVAHGKRDVAYASIAVGEIIRRPDTFKPIAFYLPQMHPIPENDRAWGRGFTEWTNVSKATPQFADHYQPKLPGELGFYDLRQPEVLYRQIELAKLFGVYAFCFHYYWFNGRRLLERPLDMFLADKTMDFKFCLCWANENWTKNWDGLDNEIIIAQQHSVKDHEQIFEDLLRYLRDDRYVRIDGRPVIVVYRPGIISELQALVQIWRRKATEAGLRGIYLVATNSFGFQTPQALDFDAICEFPPHGLAVGRVDVAGSLLNPDYKGSAYSYQDVVAAELKNLRSPPSNQRVRFPGVMPAWDNEARRPGRGNVFHGSTPALFHTWLTAAAAYVSERYAPDKRLVFINAWNEWAEGAYLEPDRRFGYAYLAAVRNVVQEINAAPEPLRNLAAAYNGECGPRASSDTVICLHIYYASLISEFADIVAQAKRARQLDVIVSIPDSWTEADFAAVRKEINPIHVLVTENRGRDIWPFIQVLSLGRSLGYKFGCKVHSKLSTHLTDGDAWRRRLVGSLLAPQTIEKLGSSFFSESRVGFAGMEHSFQSLREGATVFHNLENMRLVMSRLGVTRPQFDEFIAGSMFWFRFEAFRGLANGRIDASWFEEELGQIDGTNAHAFERVFISYVRAMGWEVAKCC